MPKIPSLEDRLAAMGDDELTAVDLASLDAAGQDALLREVSRRARKQEAQEARRADIAVWKLRGRLLRWALVALLAAALAIAHWVMN